MDVLTAIRERRSINFFDRDFQVSDDLLRELVGLANTSPSSFNLQPWRIVIVKDPARKAALRRCAMDQPKAEEASAVFIVIADPWAVEENVDRMLDSWQALGYMKPDMRGVYRGMIDGLYGDKDSLKRRMFAVKNASLFAMSVMVAARGLGLETHPMDGFDEDALKKEFDIPARANVPMLIAVGRLRPGTTLLPRAFRREIDEFARFG